PTAFKMVRMMQGVIDNGTGRRARGYGVKGPAAGKTGTTNDQSDAWFIGYTPQILAGAWVGCDDRYLRFGSLRLGQGAAAALPIWAYFMKRVYADPSLKINPDAKFIPPDDFSECGGSIDPGGYSGYSDQNGGNNSDYEEAAPIIPDREWAQ